MGKVGPEDKGWCSALHRGDQFISWASYTVEISSCPGLPICPKQCCPTSPGVVLEPHQWIYQCFSPTKVISVDKSSTSKGYGSYLKKISCSQALPLLVCLQFWQPNCTGVLQAATPGFQLMLWLSAQHDKAEPHSPLSPCEFPLSEC